MARTSLSAAKAELFALLANVSTGAPVAALTAQGVTIVYDHEPAPGQQPRDVAITLATVGQSPLFWQLALRLYVPAQVDAKAAQDTIDTAMPAIDALMTDGFGPSQWTVDWIDDIQAFVAENRLDVGRDDYF